MPPGPSIIAAMTDRGLPIVDGAPACPFVAFEDDRDGRAQAPDHRHRCFAESKPAPRALAHQEAYCLASAFPVCPAFQDWARREAAAARPGFVEAPAPREDTPPPVPTSVPLPPRDRDPRHPTGTDAPLPLPPRRNPTRDWAAPPPWSADDPGRDPALGLDRDPAHDRSRHAPPAAGAAGPAAAGAGWGLAAQGLAGSAADRLAGPDPDAPVPSRSSRYTPPAASGDRDPLPRSRDQVRRPPVEDPSEVFGPAWEQPGRYEAYPSLRTRVGLPSMGGGIPRLGVAVIALVLAAVALFFVGPMLLGIGGDNGGIGTGATPGATIAAATPTPAVTAVPAPTPQLYVVAKGDTMSKIAKRFGVSVEQLLLANPQVKDPNKIKIGDELTIPVPELDGVPDAGDASTTP